MQPLFNLSGDAIKLAHRLGRGGEGEVYQLASRADWVAKIYHNPVPGDKAEKLRLMASLKSDALQTLTAWPIDVLVDQQRKVCGFIMPNVAGHKDIHQLYSPKSRKTEFPAADFRFILRSAANVARAFGAIHATGTVIGDVNHGGVTVSQKATVKLIDCDSFQVTGQGRRFLCEVGVPTFTPPELQNRPFRGVVRTANHDNFGLAVLIFHLLFMGRHPFAGRPPTREDVPIEKAISELRFPYSANRAQARLDRPPNSLELRQMTDELASMFEMAFSKAGIQDGVRPKAADWMRALDRIENSLKSCGANRSHHYPGVLARCPWCALEASNGIQFFGVTAQTGDLSDQQILRELEQKITAIMSPGAAPFLSTTNQTTSTSPWLVSAKSTHVLKKVVGFASFVGIFFALQLLPEGARGVTAIGLAALGAYLLFTSTKDMLIREATTRVQAAKGKIEHLRKEWIAKADETVFTAARRDLQAKMELLKKIQPYRQELMNVLQRDKEKRQRENFLDRQDIEMAKVKGIGPGRSAILASYGIESALDVEIYAILRVPGFGPKTAKKLVDWRRIVEARFRFNPNAPFEGADLAEVERKVALKKQDTAKEILAGIPALNQIRLRVLEHRSRLRPLIDAAAKEVELAQNDLAALKR